MKKDRQKWLGATLPSTWPFLISLALFLLFSAIYRWSVPPFEGPDEAEHFAYILWLAEGKGLPPQGEMAWQTAIRQEAGQPPLYYLLAAVPVRLVAFNEPAAIFRPNPHFPSSAPGAVADNKNVAIYDTASAWPWRGGWLALQLARTVSLVLGLALLTAVYLLAGELARGQRLIPATAVLLVAVLPQVVFLSNVISNDIAAATAATLFLWMLLRLVRRGVTMPQVVLLGLAFGLAALSKSNTLVLALPLAAAGLWLWWRQPVARFTLVQSGAVWALVAGITGGWWYWRNWYLYGSLFGLEAHYLAPWAFAEAQGRVAANAEWVEVFLSFWAAFGWGNIKWPGWVYSPLAALTIAAVAGLFLSIRQQWRLERRLTFTLLSVGLLGGTLLSTTVALEIWMRQVTAPHGRLLFPALGAVAILLVVGWRAIHPWLALSGPLYLALLTLAAPFWLLQPAYAPPRPLSTAGAAALPESLGWQFGDIAELHSVTPLLTSADAGESLPVRVCWRPLRPAERDYTIFLHLVGPQNEVVASRYTYPGLGSYPTSRWQTGVLFCDLIGIDIPLALPRTLRYHLAIGLLDLPTQQRLPVYDSAGQPLSHTFVTAVRLATAGNRAPSTLSGNGRDPIELLAYEVEQPWRPGQRHRLTVDWRLQQAIDRDYTTFVHLRNDIGVNVAQADGPPLEGWYPTSWWQVGETVSDERLFLLPLETAPGFYHLVAGWYDPVDGMRLGGQVELGTIEVRP
jgi:hypothetical protein